MPREQPSKGKKTKKKKKVMYCENCSTHGLFKIYFWEKVLSTFYTSAIFCWSPFLSSFGLISFDLMTPFCLMFGILFLSLLFFFFFSFFFFFFFFFFFWSFVFCLFRATLAAYGGSQARGRVGPTAAGLHYSHRNTRSKPCLRPTPQLKATPDP